MTPSRGRPGWIEPWQNMVQLCLCGRGLPSRTAVHTDKRHGEVSGQPMAYLKGHWHRGKVVSEETRRKLAESHLGELAYNWRGDGASYRALHGWLNKHHPRCGKCESCGASGKTVYALTHGREYSRSRDDYRELCQKCHMQYDLGGREVSDETRQKISVGRKVAWDRQKGRKAR
jgi:hypothetical protein